MAEREPMINNNVRWKPVMREILLGYGLVRIIVPPAIVLVALPLALIAYRDGPPPDMTGGFGEMTCQSCHSDQPLNDPDGVLEIEGVSGQFTPGRTYRITIRLRRENLRRGGFEMSARFASGPDRGKQAGGFLPLGAAVKVIHSETDPRLEFIEQTSEGALAALRGVIEWTFEWAAPMEGSTPVEFDIAGNASNNDSSALGDYIYQKSIRLARE